MKRVTEEGLVKYTELTPDQYAEAILFTRERQIPVEYGTHVDHTPNLHVILLDPSDPVHTVEFEAALAR